MKKTYLFCALMPLALMACNQENDLKLQEGTVSEPTQEVDYFSNPNNNLLPENGNEITVQPTANPNAAVVTPPAPSNSNVKLNPEHGQPGHRCDIPVGAPLNSAPQQAPTQAAAPPVQLTPQTMPAQAPTTAPAQSTPPSLSQSGNVKLNPEHGQPGHRCEIAVGAPLPN